jgi:hypothetical protein
MSLSATDIVVMIVFGVMFTAFVIALSLTLRPLNKVIADLKKLELQLREFANEKHRPQIPKQVNEPKDSASSKLRPTPGRTA